MSKTNEADIIPLADDAPATAAEPPPAAVAQSTFDEDGFEVIDNPSNTAAAGAEAVDLTGLGTRGSSKSAAPADATLAGTSAASQRTIAVNPISSVLPLLQNLSSPFVLGPSKAARAVSTTE